MGSIPKVNSQILWSSSGALSKIISAHWHSMRSSAASHLLSDRGFPNFPPTLTPYAVEFGTKNANQSYASKKYSERPVADRVIRNQRAAKFGILWLILPAKNKKLEESATGLTSLLKFTRIWFDSPGGHSRWVNVLPQTLNTAHAQPWFTPEWSFGKSACSAQNDLREAAKAWRSVKTESLVSNF